jgi:NAD(P)-dependent dehydrogenase (short-subunit alcohol dehydrogenase family)
VSAVANRADPLAALRGAPVVVSGGAGGIGVALLGELKQAGLQTASIDLRASGAATLDLVADVADPAAVAAAVARVADELGAPGALVCAAGVVSEHPLGELEPAEWRRVLDASLTSGFLLARAVAPHLVARGGGAIAMVSTGYATKGMLHGPHYAAAKAGVEALVKSLALELGPSGVRVNAVAAGPVRTPMLDAKPGFDEAAVAATLPLRRVGRTADVVDPLLFLLGSGSDWITGQVLHVNGGMLMP